MIQLNLPSADFRIREEKGKRLIFDSLRRKYVKLTPEEWVRQHFVNYLTQHKGYPTALLANEMELKIGAKRLRCDTLLYNRYMQPRMIIEYKAPHITISQQVFEQIASYNTLLHVDYLVVSNGLQHYCCKMNYEQHSMQFLKQIPDYSEICGE